jgi:hypothetical protein
MVGTCDGKRFVLLFSPIMHAGSDSIPAFTVCIVHSKYFDMRTSWIDVRTSNVCKRSY